MTLSDDFLFFFFVQLQPPASLSISVLPIVDGLNESKGEPTTSEGKSNETNVSQSSPILSETISPSPSSPWHSVTTDEQS